MAINAIVKFLNAARSLVDQGLSKEAIEQFARNEFGEINELFQKQINNLFKPKQGIENIKIKDEVFDDTVIKLPIDDTGKPFNPRDPLKDYSKELTDSPLDDLKKIVDDFEPMGPPKPRDKKYTGGMVDVEPNLSDIGHGSDALMARTRLMSPGSQATTSTGLNYLLAEDNDNIRVPFENGKNFEMYLKDKQEFNRKQNAEQLYREYLEDMRRKKVMQQKQEAAEGGRIGFSKGKLADVARRKFMKTAGAAGAGIAALKSGIIGLGKEAVPMVEAATETIKQAPSYFFDLANTIKMFGRKSKVQIQDRVDEYFMPSKDGKSELMLTEDVGTGEMQIKKIGKENDEMVSEVQTMEYSPGSARADESTKGTPADDYQEYTEYNSRIYKDEFNDPDVVDGINVEDITKELIETKTKKASGGIARMIGE